MEPARTTDVAKRYRAFANNEVRDRSAPYASWAAHVAQSPDIINLISSLPELKRQPVLVFAATRSSGLADHADAVTFGSHLQKHWDHIAAIVAERSTQTNEATRSAVFAPFLAAIAGPITLIEIGASAGLNLLPDYYRMEWTIPGRALPHVLEPSKRLTSPDVIGEPVIRCELRGGIPAPQSLPEIVERIGIDPNPLDANSEEDRQWLESLVWPGQSDRVSILRSALDVVAVVRPKILSGGVLERLDEAIETAPQGSTPVVLNSTVLAYLDGKELQQSVDRIRAHDCLWLSYEGVTIIPEIADKLPSEIRERRGLFVVAVDGTPLATAQGHGAWVRAIN